MISRVGTASENGPVSLGVEVNILFQFTLLPLSSSICVLFVRGSGSRSRASFKEPLLSQDPTNDCPMFGSGEYLCKTIVEDYCLL